MVKVYDHIIVERLLPIINFLNIQIKSLETIGDLFPYLVPTWIKVTWYFEN